jgi:elongation factor Tu
MPVSRSFISILRTSRTALSQSRGANPVNRVFGHDRFAARTYATVFERTKPHVNIGENFFRSCCSTRLTGTGTIGHVDHGKVI